jgi:hypothetical protein
LSGFGFDAGCCGGEAGVQAAVLPFEGEVCHAWREFRADGVEYAVGGGCELAAALSDAVDGVGEGVAVDGHGVAQAWVEVAFGVGDLGFDGVEGSADVAASFFEVGDEVGDAFVSGFAELVED